MRFWTRVDAVRVKNVGPQEGMNECILHTESLGATGVDCGGENNGIT